MKRLDQYITNQSKLSGAMIGINIRSRETGDVLYNHMGKNRFRPASNMKLLTAAAALSVLGQDYKFSTELRTNGSVNKKTLTGNLYLKGKGDPTLLPANFGKFAAKLREQGIRLIEGDIIGDDTWYDAVRLSQGLSWSDEQYDYGAQVSALTISPTDDYVAGTVVVEVTPGAKAGEQPAVRVSPAVDYVEISNEAMTVDGEKEAELIIEREHGTNRMIVKGTIAVTAETEQEGMSVWDPTLYSLSVFQQAMSGAGISWTGSVKTGKTPDDTALLLSEPSMPLKELLVPFMKQSNNGHGEMLIKEMGKAVLGEGSWEQGLEVMKAALPKFQLNTETMSLKDGSGISHFNLIPPSEISKLLYHVQREEWFPVFLESLPVAGHADRIIGGTLQDRMHGLHVQAKTGTIHAVSTLSGYTETKTGEQLIFSIMINNLLDEEEGKDIEDELLEIIVNAG